MHSRRFSHAAAAAVLLACRPAPAQVAPASSSPPVPAGDKVVELTPFTVTADQDVGYLAGNTLAGSRLNTRLKDTAASISVMTEEFLKDIGAQDLSEALVYGNNLQLNRDDDGSFGDAPNGNGQLEFNQRYRVRGINAQVARNYFRWENPTDIYNVGRVEDSRGPNSVLFGTGSAGGVINVSTKQAELKRAFRTISAAVDNHGSRRVALDLNQPIGEKGAVRVNALWNDARFHQHHAFAESRRLHLAGKYRLTPRVQLRGEFETGELEENRGRNSGTSDSLIPWLDAGRPTFALNAPNAAFAGLGTRLGANQLRYISNSDRLINMTGQITTSGSSAPIVDRAIADDSINPGGPGQVRENPFNAASVFLEAELGRKTFLELAFNHQYYDYESYDPSNATPIRGDANTTLPGTLGANPNAGGLFFECIWRLMKRSETSNTGRFMFSTEHDAGKWGTYRVAFLGEYEKREFTNGNRFEVWEGRPFNAAATAAANRVTRRTYIVPGDWGSYYANGPLTTGLIRNMTDPITGRTLSSTFSFPQAANDDPAEQWSGLIGLQASWFGGRLIAGTGYREDRVSIHDRSQMTDAEGRTVVDYANVTEVDATGRTHTLGLVAHVNKQVSLLYNQARNIDTPASMIRVLPTSAIATPPEGKGQDYGVGLDLLDGRLYARAVRYTTSTAGEVGFGGAAYQNSSNAILDGLHVANLITTAEHASRYLDGVNGTRTDKETRGYELSLIANPTANWRLSVNYSRTEGAEDNIIAEIVDWWQDARAFYRTFPPSTPTGIGADTVATEIQEQDDRIADTTSVAGIGIIGNRRHKANFFTRYTFSRGWLKGAYLGGGYRYQGRMLAGRAVDGVTLQYAPPIGEASFLVGYNTRLGNKARLGFQLNITNLFDETDPIITRYFATGDLKRARRIIVREPRLLRLSATCTF